MIVHRQEELAIRLLDRALDKAEAPGGVAVPKNEPPIDVQLDVFAKVGQWVAVKNKLTEMEDTQLDEFKRRIHADQGKADKKRAYDADAGGTPLRRLQARLPSASARGDDGDRDDLEREDPAAA